MPLPLIASVLVAFARKRRKHQSKLKRNMHDESRRNALRRSPSFAIVITVCKLTMRQWQSGESPRSRQSVSRSIVLHQLETLMPAKDREELIRARAHDLWELEGRPEGASERHWLQAAAEVDAAPGKPAAKKAKAPAKPKAVTAKVAAPKAVAAKPAAKKAKAAK